MKKTTKPEHALDRAGLLMEAHGASRRERGEKTESPGGAKDTPGPPAKRDRRIFDARACPSERLSPLGRLLAINRPSFDLRCVTTPHPQR